MPNGRSKCQNKDRGFKLVRKLVLDAVLKKPNIRYQISDIKYHINMK